MAEVDFERIEAIVRQVAEEVYDRRWSMRHQVRSASAADSARFVLEHIPLHLARSHYDLRRDAVLAAPPGGLFLEFGVWKGSWIRQMAAVRDVKFFGFDSFEGLPEAWSTYQAGTFDLGGELPHSIDREANEFSGQRRSPAAGGSHLGHRNGRHTTKSVTKANPPTPSRRSHNPPHRRAAATLFVVAAALFVVGVSTESDSHNETAAAATAGRSTRAAGPP